MGFPSRPWAVTGSTFVPGESLAAVFSLTFLPFLTCHPKYTLRHSEATNSSNRNPSGHFVRTGEPCGRESALLIPFTTSMGSFKRQLYFRRRFPDMDRYGRRLLHNVCILDFVINTRIVGPFHYIGHPYLRRMYMKRRKSALAQT